MKMRTWPLLGMAEEDFIVLWGRVQPEASGRIQTEWVMRRGGGSERRKQEKGQVEDQEKSQGPKQCMAKMANLYENEKPGLWKGSPALGLERFKQEDRVRSSGESHDEPFPGFLWAGTMLRSRHSES